jgi:hypothetical protein
MRLSKKLINKGRKKLQQDLFFGKKSFRKFKETTNTFLQDSSRMWDNLPQPITKKDKEYREGVVGIASLGSVFLARVREAEAYRKSIKFRNCKYKKYIDTKQKETIYSCKFFKIIENTYKTNYFCITNQKYKGGLKAELIKQRWNYLNSVLKVVDFAILPAHSLNLTCFSIPNQEISMDINL